MYAALGNRSSVSEVISNKFDKAGGTITGDTYIKGWVRVGYAGGGFVICNQYSSGTILSPHSLSSTNTLYLPTSTGTIATQEYVNDNKPTYKNLSVKIYKSSSTSIPKESTKEVSYDVPSSDGAVLGIVGITYTNSYYVSLNSFYSSGNSLQANMRNDRSSSYNTVVSFRVLLGTKY